MRRMFWVWVLSTSLGSGLWAGVGYWSWLGPVSGEVTALHVTTNALYVAIEGQGLFRYDLSSQTWDTLVAPGSPIRAIYVHPVNPNDLLVGIDATVGVTVWRSQDGGLSWAPSDSGLTAPGLSDVLPVRAIAGTAQRPDTVFLATMDGAWMSPDFGAHWLYVFSEDPAYYYNARTLTIATPETLFLGSQNFVYEGQVWRSVDGGQTWDFLWGTYDVGGEGLLNGITQHPRVPALLLVAVGGFFVPGIYRSLDGGMTFTQTFSAWANAVLFHPQDSSVAYAATDANGVLKSQDAGLTWSEINDSLPLGEVDLLVMGSDERTIFIGTPIGVYAYTDPYVSVEERSGSFPSPLLSLTPNPVRRWLTLRAYAGQIQSVAVYALDGRSLGQIQRHPNAIWRVDLSPYGRGPRALFLEIRTTRGRMTKRVFVIP